MNFFHFLESSKLKLIAVGSALIYKFTNMLFDEITQPIYYNGHFGSSAGFFFCLLKLINPQPQHLPLGNGGKKYPSPVTAFHNSAEFVVLFLLIT